MYTYLLQDWIFIQSGPGPATLVQSAASWLEVGAIKDVVFWIQIASVDDGGFPGYPELIFETAPIPDDSLFKQVALPIGVSVLSTPLVRLVRKDAGSTSVPVGAWLRWKLRHTSVDVAWHVEMRIYCAVNPAYVLEPGENPGLVIESGREATRDQLTDAKKRSCGECS